MGGKIWSRILAAMLACALLPLAACGAGEAPQDIITAGITRQLDELADGESDARADLASSISDSGALDSFGVDAREFTDALLDGFSYKIGEVTVDEDAGTATAKVTLTCKSVGDIATAALDATAQLAADPDAASLTEADVKEKVGQIILDAAKGAKAHDTELTLDFTEGDDGWSANEDVAGKVATALIDPSSEAADPADGE